MAVDSKHPKYVQREPEWLTMRDCMGGETAVKARGALSVVGRPNVQTDPSGESTVQALASLNVSGGYLPMPSGFSAQPDGGRLMFAAYVERARFPDIVEPTLRGMVGLIHGVEAQIELPPRLESLYENATVDGLSLEAFHRRITTQLLETGRYSVLPDLPKDGGDAPVLAGYEAECLINWNDSGTLFVLDESSQKIDPVDEFNWVDDRRFRVLRLIDGVYSQQVYDGPGLVGGERTTSTLRGRLNDKIKRIPLVVMSAHEVSLEIQAPPLLGTARSALSIFRLDADYRHQLFMSGQETFVITGAEGSPSAVGSGVVLNLPMDCKAEYVGPDCKGIEAHRLAIRDDREAAAAASSRLLDTSNKGGVESGEALRIRLAAQTATLVSVALSGAQGLERSLKNAAEMVGDDPSKVLVKPDLKFVQQLLEPKAAIELVKMWQADAISYDTMYENLQRGGIASVERTADDERGLITSQEPPPGAKLLAGNA